MGLSFQLHQAEAHTSSVTLRPGWWQRLRILAGKPIQVRIGHRGPIDKIVVDVGETVIGTLPGPEDK